MLSPDNFKKYGLDTDSLKTLFTTADRSDKIKQFVGLCRDRIKDGRERSLRDYQVWAAVDLAYDAPFNQHSPTLIRHVLDTCHTTENIYAAVKSWGLCESDLFCKRRDESGKEIYELNAPVFFETLIPIVRAYMTVRVGKIFNDRNLLPLFKYEPLKYTELNRVRCEIITDIVQAMTAQMGYAATLRQMIFQALLYSICLKFPMEAWYSEKSEDEAGSIYTEKEGLRYVTPHITRLFYDMQHPLCSFNTDSGCSFAGYWSILRWGDVDRNNDYWNKTEVSYGYNWMDKSKPYANYFEQAYPCTIELPQMREPVGKETDRELIANRYSTTDYDKAVFVTYLFQKIIPSEWGIGTYDKPVWIRTIIASDDTVIHAEAFPYCPVIYAGYDADSGRGRNASLALEIIPFQDQMANIITQMLLTIKRNLANIVFYDTNVVDDSQVEQLRVHTQWQYQRINLVGYDSFKQRVAHSEPRNAFHEVKFQYADISQATQAFVTLMNILERLLVVSPQEIGGQATHQQSKAEVVIVAGNTTNRVSYTASFIDEAIDAWKKQLYQAAIAYLDSDVAGQVSTDIPNLQARLKELGFKSDDVSRGQRKVAVKGTKTNLRTLEGFASTRNGPERGNDRETAQAELMTVQSINQNQRLAQIVDPLSIIELIEQAAKHMGADSDFNIRVIEDALKVQTVQDAIPQIMELVMKQVAENIAKPAAEAVAEQEQKNVAQDQALAQQGEALGQQGEVLAQQAGVIKQIMDTLAKMDQTMALAMKAMPLQPPGVIDAGQPPPMGEEMPPPAMPPAQPENAGQVLPVTGPAPEAVPGMVG